MELSKAFDTINHEFLLAKLHAYGFNKGAPKIIHNYLNNTYQRKKINVLSSWSEVLLGLLLCDIYLSDLNCVAGKTNSCSFADNMTFHACVYNLGYLVKILEHDANLAAECFDSNYMKLNQDKYQLIIFGHKFEAMWAEIGMTQILESKEQTLEELVKESYLNFD